MHSDSGQLLSGAERVSVTTTGLLANSHEGRRTGFVTLRKPKADCEDPVLLVHGLRASKAKAPALLHPKATQLIRHPCLYWSIP